MKVLVQRVKQAKVTVEEKVVGAITEGLLVYVGFKKGDTASSYLVDKVVRLRIFPDQEEKMQLSLLDIQGEILIVSQFTLYGNCQKGNRPSFIDSLEPVAAKVLYDDYIQKMKGVLGEEKVKSGVFGARMEVTSTNIGPLNFILEH